MTEENKKEQPIIIIKKNIKHGGHHGGAWKVALADFMTAMFALFLVMWLVNQSDEVKQAVEGYFQDPVGYTKAYQAGLLKSGQGITKMGGSGPSRPNLCRVPRLSVVDRECIPLWI